MEKIIPIARLAVKLSEVKRAIGYRKGHLENDSEHSFQLALVSWLANQSYDLKLDDNLLFKFALVHDLVEVYAGDVDAFGDKEALGMKAENEKKALDRLEKDYAEYEPMLEAIKRYEKKEDPEAQLVGILDKTVADINLYYGNSSYYKDKKITIDMWREWLLNKIKMDNLDDKIKKVLVDSMNMVEESFNEFFFSPE